MEKKIIVYLLLLILTNTELILISNTTVGPTSVPPLSNISLSANTTINGTTASSGTPRPIIPRDVVFSVIDC